MSRFSAACGGLLLIACGPPPTSPPSEAQTRYRSPTLITGPAYDTTYDRGGRLSSISTPAGDSAQYVYDPAGNLLEIRRYASGTLSIFDFQPGSGSPGQIITVTGEGFSPTPSSNTVLLNGLACDVLSATSAQLTFSVPQGATTGFISVTSGANTATSSSSFSVTGTAVSITDFSPKVGSPGTLVSVSGSGFDTQAFSTSAFIGGTLASLNGPPSPSNMQVVVAPGTTTGKPSITTPFGTATSSSTFFMLPGTYTSSDIVSTGDISSGGTTSVTIPVAGKTALLAFVGMKGQGLSLLATNLTIPGSTTLTVFRPDLTVLASGPASGTSTKIDLGLLPSTGTYTIAIQASPTGSGSIDLQLIRDPTGTLTLDGPGTSVDLALAQNAEYTFTATAADDLSVGVSAFATTPAGGSGLFQVLAPNLTLLWSGRFTGPASWRLSIPISGTYTLRVVPDGPCSASTTILLSRPLTGLLTAGAAATVIPVARPGQAVRYTFSGAAGQGMSLRATTDATFPDSSSIGIYNPDGTTLRADTLYSNRDTKIDLNQLPQTGTYLVYIQPNGAATGSVALTLWNDDASVIAVDGDPLPLSLGAGQNGRYTFSGAANDSLALGFPSVVTIPSGAAITLQIFTPDGAFLSNTTCGRVGLPTSCQIWSLPVTGIYTLRVLPDGAYSAEASLLLSRPLTGALAAAGTPTAIPIARAGQTVRYTFSGTAGQGMSLRATTDATLLDSNYIAIYNPDGTTLRVDYLNGGRDAKLDLNQMPQTGTYLIYIRPNGAATGSVTLTLWNDDTGAIPIDGDPLPLSLNGGQNGRYTFSGAVNDSIALGLASVATVPSGAAMTLQIFKPDGTLLSNTNCGWVGSPTSCQMWGLPVTGTYTLRVVPDGTHSATTTILLSRPLTGALAAAGTPTAIPVARAGQTVRYTFSGTAGQGMSLRATTDATFPDSSFIGIYNPDGTTLTTDLLYTGRDVKLDFNQMPQTGTYLVYIQPNGAATGSVTLTLWNDDAAAISIDGDALPLSLGAGQNGRYTFSGSANDSIALGIPSVATTPSGAAITLKIFKPDGTLLSNTNCGWVGFPTSCQMWGLPVAGVYTMRVLTEGAHSATASLLLSRPLTGALAAGTPTAIPVARAGQTVHYTFSGTAGQGMSLRATTDATFPDSSFIGIYNPDGTTLKPDVLYTGRDVKMDFNQMPQTGTYLVYIQPNGAATGSVTLTPWNDDTGDLPRGGAATVLALGAGQDGRYTVSGSTGDALTFSVTGLSTGPAGGNVTFQLYDPSGITFWGVTAGTGGTWSPPRLQTTGVYTLRVLPPGTSSANLTLVLSP